jgi:hypothetical protein
MNGGSLKNVLMVFPSPFSAKRGAEDKLKAIVKKKLLANHIKVNKITSEEKCIVFDVTDVVKAAELIVEVFGIDKVAIAKHVRSEFTEVVKTIVNIGKQIILPKEKFFVKVKVSSNTELHYVARDVEFASLGDLTAELSAIAAVPAKNEYDANKIILSYIGGGSTYVCFQLDKAVGGLPFGCQNKIVSCGIHNVLSCISTLITIKCGFIPDFSIFYTNQDDLRENVKLFGHIVTKMNTRKCKIRMMHLDLPDDKYGSRLKLMLKESISARALTFLPRKDLTVSLSVTIYPPWFVQETVNRISSAGKIPWVPLLFLTDCLYYDIKSMDLGDDKIIMYIDKLIGDTIGFKKYEYKKYEKKIDALSKETINNMKTISLDIGPNYIHDIIDSI